MSSRDRLLASFSAIPWQSSLLPIDRKNADFAAVFPRKVVWVGLEDHVSSLSLHDSFRDYEPSLPAAK